MPHYTTKSTKWPVCQAKSSTYAWRRLGSLATHWALREDSDQTKWVPRLICVFAGRTGHFDGFVMQRILYLKIPDWQKCHCTTKQAKTPFRPAMTPISPGMRPVWSEWPGWSEASLCAFIIVKYTNLRLRCAGICMSFYWFCHDPAH